MVYTMAEFLLTSRWLAVSTWTATSRGAVAPNDELRHDRTAAVMVCVLVDA